ncbi:MAG: 7-carboxy-7-deazaguanine synthase QueE [Candidatus Omnitrophica bacterium]|nr:7-carboxy-7-deazaguanine synthase QueE [Candidatus Omnitrophota bacterium]
MTGRISEVFDSVQGEGIFLGEKQLFVRFHGCNLNCSFCDTKQDNFKEYQAHELLEEIKSYHDDYHSISFTGGEPLLQKDFLKELLFYTSCYGFKNYLETNGTLVDELEEVIDLVDFVAMDLKFPTSICQDKPLWQEHHDFLKVASRKQVFLKSVICRSTKVEDLEISLDLIKKINKAAILVLQPNYYEEDILTDKLEKFKKICLNNQVAACVIPQMHKVVGVK